jgi:hypothetical protein
MPSRSTWRYLTTGNRERRDEPDELF